MTAAEFTAIVAELHDDAAGWLRCMISMAEIRFTESPPVWIIGVCCTDHRFKFCRPTDYVTSKTPVCWITWETRRSDDELRDVLGQALSVLMRELGMEWPR